MMSQPLWRGLVLGLGLAWCLPFLPAAQAQLDIFEKNNDAPPPRRRGFTFGTIRLNTQGGQKEMQQGNTFYAQGNYAAASLMFYRVVKNAAGSRFFPTAQFQLGITLYRMGLYHAAIDHFTDIIRTGPSHSYFKQAISYVLTISRKLKNEAMFLGKLRTFSTSTIPPKQRNELFYLLGKYYFQRRDLPLEKRLPLAMDLLRKVRTNEPEFYARAQYIIGAVYDAAIPSQPNNAARAFKSAARAAMKIQDKEIRQRVFELGILGIARIHYSAKHFSGAARWYQAIPRNSPRWLESLFEMAWSYLRLGRYEETLGLMHTLESPYFKNEYYPELGILRAVGFFERCRYSEVKNIIKAYLERYRPLLASIKDFTKRNPNDGKMFQALIDIQRQQDDNTAGLDDDPSAQMFQRILKLAFRDKPLQVMFSYIKEIDRELSVIESSSAAWKQSEIGVELIANLRKDRLKKISEAGARARRRILQAQNELQVMIGQALKIRYETLGAEKDRMSQASNASGGFTMKTKGKVDKNRQLITVSVADDYTFWPFQGEYWVDELGYYRYRIKGECHRK